MHKALRQLLYLRARAMIRKLLRGARRPRGLLYLLIGGFVVGTWLCGSLFGAVVTSHRVRQPTEWLPAMVPLFLLAHTVSSVLQFRSGMVTFSPAEVDFLFPGPFTRRELLTYKLSGRLAGCALSAVFISLAFIRQAPAVWQLYVGMTLTLVFVQLIQVAAALVGLTVAERVHKWGRLILAVLLVILIAAALAQTPAIPTSRDELVAWWQTVSSSLPGRVLLGPFQVFANAMLTTGGALSAVKAMALAGAIDAALLALVFWLDANYLESSLAASQQRYERLQRAQQGRRVARIRVSQRRSRVPVFRWWWGAGPTAWRQLTAALRTGTMLVVLSPIVFALAILAGAYQAEVALGVVSVLSVYLTLIVVAQARYDFRGDLDNIPWLKTLPLSPLALAAGQLITPVAISTAVVLSALAGLGAAVGYARLVLASIAPFVPIGMLLIVGIENAFFLFFPSRTFLVNVGELQSVGRFIVVFFCKALVLGTTVGTAVGMGGLAYLVSGQSVLAAATVSWLTIAAAACATVPVVAWAFIRFDPGVDTPA